MATTVPAEDPQKPNIEAVLDEKLHISEPTTTEVASSSKDPSIAGNGIVTDQHTDTKAAPEGTVAEEKQLESSVHPEIPPTGPVKAPFPHPLPQCKPAPHAELTADQQKKYDELLKLVASWTTVPATSARFGAAKDPITDDDRLWLTRECLLRYLRATKFVSASAAATRLQQTLTWRREYGLHKFTPEYISPENETGKQVILGYDNDGRPCLYLNPSKQNTQKSDRQLHHLVYMLERVIDLMPEGQETSALLINFKETSNGSGPSVAQGRATLVILQGHYPERLGRALISELPWYISTFFKLISAFIDPVTKSKMKFNEPLVNHVPAAQLQNAFGGEVDFEYDHSTYWPALARLAEERRKVYRERWEAAGKKIGESEFFLRSGKGESEGLLPTL